MKIQISRQFFAKLVGRRQARLGFHRSLAFAATMAAFCVGSNDLRAASAVYTGTAGDGIFDTGTNWSTGVAPGDTTAGVTTNADVATFQLTTGTTLTLNAQRNLGSLTFQGASANTTVGSFVIGTAAGPALLLSSGGTILFGTISFGQTINAPLALQNASGGTSGAYTFQTDTPGTSRVSTFGGAITGAATSGTTTLTLTGTSTTNNTLNGVISNGAGGGALALAKTGTGTWQINNAGNTFSGGVTASAGTLRMNTAGNTSTALGTGTVTFNGGTVTLGSTTATTLNNAVAVNAGTTSFLIYRANGFFNPTSATGTGTLILNNSNTAATVLTSSSFQGFGGTVDIESNGTTATTALRLASGADQTSLQNATLNLGTNASLTQQAGTNSTITSLIGALSGSGTLGGSGAGSGTFVYQIGSNNASTTFTGTVVNGGSQTAITKVGTGTLTLTGANSQTGLTTLNAGTLNINGVNALGGGNYAGLTINGGTLQYAAGATGNGSLDVSNIGGVAKPVSFGAGGATIDTNGNNVTFANTVGNGGGGALTKAGTGILTLAAANTYTGGTIINAGNLTISLNGGLSSGNTTVAAGATLELGAGVTAAHSLTTSTLSLLATNSMVMLDGPVGTVQDTVQTLLVAGTAVPNGTYGAVGSGATFILPEFTGTGVLAVVPEPSTWALMFGGIAGLAIWSVRRQRCA